MEIIVRISGIVLSVLTIIGSTGTAELQRDLGEHTPPAELRYVETDAEQEGNELLFGNLVIELPEGVCAETETEAGMGLEEGLAIRLIGAQELVGDTEEYRGTGPFPPKIGIARYTAEYECEEALIDASLDLFSEGSLQVLYENKEDNEYVFLLDKPDSGVKYNSSVLVLGEDLYLVREFGMERGYSFSALREQGNIRWQDGRRVVGSGTDNDNSFYSRVMPEEDMSFLFHAHGSEAYFYLEGYFDDPYEFLQAGKDVRSFVNGDWADVNFDGYMDLSIDGKHALIWDSTEKEYVYVRYPDHFPYYASRRKNYPETKTVLNTNTYYLTDAYDDHDMDYTEHLWQWEGCTLVEKRECRAEIREDGARIWAYEGTVDNIMFDENFTLAEWDSGDNEDITVLYEQFYDGYVPREISVLEGRRRTGKIPQGLLDEITACMMNGTELPTLKAMMNAAELDKEACYAAAEKNDDIRAQVLMSLNSGYILVKGDIDNDGIEDIIGEFAMGGSDGAVSFRLFQGKADGTYIERHAFGSVREEFGVIEYEGNNYLIRTLFDYGKKLYNGFSVMKFEEGKCAEEAELMLYVRDYELAPVNMEEGYEACAEEIMEKAVSYGSMVEEYEIIMGSAEELAEGDSYYPYICDLDNDGEPECYDKRIWFCSSMNARNMLTFEYLDGDDERTARIENAIQERYLGEDYYCPMMLWADEADGETIINVLYQTGLWDFVIVGYVVDGSELFEVYEIAADAVLGVEQTCR